MRDTTTEMEDMATEVSDATTDVEDLITDAEGTTTPAEKPRDSPEKPSGWLICTICGSRFIPSRTSKVDSPECADVVKHAQFLRESRPGDVAHCSFCLKPLPEGSRKSRLFCDANCRNKYAYHINKDKGTEEGLSKDTSFYAKSQEGATNET
jgi:hypothetical protein